MLPAQVKGCGGHVMLWLPGGSSWLSWAWTVLGRGSTNLSRSHKATLLSPKQDEVVLTAKAAWAVACSCLHCCSRACVEKGKFPEADEMQNFELFLQVSVHMTVMP